MEFTSNIESFASFVISPVFIWLWCAFILFYALRWLTKLSWESIQLKSNLKQAQKILQGARSPEEFFERYKEIHSQFTILTRLRKPWLDFSKHLIVNTKDQKTVKTSQQCDAFFHEATVIDPYIDQRFFGAIPTHLSSLGILGTFCGLASGIFLARFGLAGNEIDAMQSALSNLLGGASLAFWTSIVGVGCSLFFSKWEKNTLKNLKEKLEELNLLLSEKTELCTQEQLAYEEKDLLVSQNKLMGQIDHYLKGFYEHRTQIEEKMLKGIVTEFRESLLQNTQIEVQKMASGIEGLLAATQATSLAVQELCTTVKSTTQEISEKSKQHGEEVFRQTATHMETLSHALQMNANKTCEVFAENISNSCKEGVAQLHAPISKLCQTIDDLNAKSTEATELWAKAVETTSKQANNVVDVQSKMQGFIEPMIETAQKISSASISVQQSLENSQELVERSCGAVSNIRDVNQQMVQNWNEYCVRFEGVDLNLKNIFEDTNGAILGFAEKFKTLTVDLDHHMSKGMTSLAGAIGDLNKALHTKQQITGTSSLRGSNNSNTEATG